VGKSTFRVDQEVGWNLFNRIFLDEILIRR
jgi:hypothetical protein